MTKRRSPTYARLILDQNGPINILLSGGNRVYLPNARVGDVLASGPLGLCESHARQFALAGYKVHIEEDK